MITIIIYKLIQLRIAPLVWYIWPTWHTDSGIGVGYDNIIARVPSGLTTPEKPKYATFRRAYRVGLITKWLCFEFQCTYMKKSEHIHRIYGKGYNCDFDQHWRERYDQLCETDYFS